MQGWSSLVLCEAGRALNAMRGWPSLASCKVGQVSYKVRLAEPRMTRGWPHLASCMSLAPCTRPAKALHCAAVTAAKNFNFPFFNLNRWRNPHRRNPGAERSLSWLEEEYLEVIELNKSRRVDENPKKRKLGFFFFWVLEKKRRRREEEEEKKKKRQRKKRKKSPFDALNKWV